MNGMARKAAGIILLVRNPFDAMLSEFNRRESADHTGQAAVELFNATIWPKRIASYTTRWQTLHYKYATEIDTAQTPILVLLYEDLKRDLEPQLDRILRFLEDTTGFHTEDDKEERISCTVKRNMRKASFKRQKSELSWEVFSPRQIELVNRQLDEINKIFLRKGFDRLPDDYYK